MSHTFRRTVVVLTVTVTMTLSSPVASPASRAAARPDPATPADAVASARADSRACTVRLDGVRSGVRASQRTVTIVNQTSKTHARLSFWVRRGSGCSFTRKLLTTGARLGYGGTTPGRTRRQGTGTTPLGTYTMSQVFGNGGAPRTRLPYHRVRSGDYWVGDNASRYYNSLRNKSQGGFRYRLKSSNRNSSEYLPRYRGQYRYAVVINFNRAPDFGRRYRGTGIFLHVRGSGATAGCVAISAGQLRTVLSYLRSGDRITIAR